MEDLKKDINSSTLILGDFNTPLSRRNRSSKQNINKYSAALNKVLDQMDLTDIYIERTFHPKEAKNTFLPNPHGIFSEIDYIIKNKKFKKIEIISSIFSNHKGLN